MSDLDELIEQLAVTALEMRAGGWRLRAACRGMDPEMFFPHQGGNMTEPTAVCRTCPVQTECLRYAMAAGEIWGIWGGLRQEVRKDVRCGRSRIVFDPVAGTVAVVVLDEGVTTDGEDQLAG